MQNSIQHTNEQTNYFPAQEKELQFFARVEFGAPSKNCQDYGICRLELIEKSSTETPLEKARYKGGCLVKISNSNSKKSRVSISFSKSNLSNHIIQKHFGTAFFQVDETLMKTFQLPNHSTESILIIPKGLHPIQENESDYIVEFF